MAANNEHLTLSVSFFMCLPDNRFSKRKQMTFTIPVSNSIAVKQEYISKPATHVLIMPSGHSACPSLIRNCMIHYVGWWNCSNHNNSQVGVYIVYSTVTQVESTVFKRCELSVIHTMYKYICTM